MHILCLGVIKKLLLFYWVGRPKKKVGISISSNAVQTLSERLPSLKRFLPVEFPRKTRGFLELAKFKATEFRFILLYCGPIILDGILPKQLFKHFLLLHCASRILCSPSLCVPYAEYAKKLYRHFFDLLPKYYGTDSAEINMHNLIHISDVINFKCTLDNLSGFPYENQLGQMKKKTSLSCQASGTILQKNE